MTATRWAWLALALLGCGGGAKVSSVTPGVARAGETVIIAGSGFGSRAGAVTFDDATATVTTWSSDRVEVVVPRQTHPEVTLTVAPVGSAAAKVPFTIFDAMTDPHGGAGAATTFVSLTFDDTTADQLSLRPVLAATGLRATFYVNSTRIGSASPDLPPYMTLDDLKSLQEEGHEIGGHTKHHFDLTLADRDEVARQVCGDRQRLLSLGLDAQSFAYPFGGQDADVQAIAASCGYGSARAINHKGAVWPAVLPLPNRFLIPAAKPVLATNTLEDLEKLVTDTEQAQRGGWVVVIFHRVCDDGCSSTAVTAPVFEAFARWLAQREASGTVTRTVRQMMGAGTPPPADVPAPPLRTTPNLIANPSLELYSRGTVNPDCWLDADTGHELAHWSKVTPGHDGEWAMQLSAGEPSTSSRRIKMLQDDGACAPAVEAGAHYQLSLWYQSDVPLRINSFLRDEAGFWSPWGLSPVLAASPGQWSLATWKLSAIPSTGRALSVNVRLQSGDGTMTVDDFSLTRLTP